MKFAQLLLPLLRRCCVALLLPASLLASLRPLAPRQVVSLDGTWQIAQGSLDSPPAVYGHTVPVPGLVDLAQPAFTEVGVVSPQRQAFWYRRTFRVEQPLPEIAELKLHKARYGSTVWLNGQLVGHHAPCFTPAYLDVRPHLRRGDNELVIRLGANRESLPPDQPSGWDFEKYRFLPGIYDSVELILAGTPYLRNVQTVPDLAAGAVRIVAEVVAGAQPAEVDLQAEVVAARTGQPAGSATAPRVRLAARTLGTVGLTVPLRPARAWSPEDPFLYELHLRTGADAARVRFGLRSFRFDPAARRAVLNNRPCYLRGSNLTLYRFFEDADRARLPWDADWVRRLHRKMKELNWNSLRYCIGFPPDFWYDIADEEGLLLQDEFPIWTLGGAKSKCPENLTAEKIIPEYTAWLRERWNHASVVIWDAQNESLTPETARARDAVRHLDLSQRPWDNGWEIPGAATDCLESHPYLFNRTWAGGKPEGGKPFYLRELATTSPVPRLQKAQAGLTSPIIINEYCWLWLNRDGRPTALTERIYQTLLGPEATADQRRLLRARYVAALTEFWRAHRQAAGVLHFCSLGYSRGGSKPRPEGGATSDDLVDLRGVRYEPYFEEYVKEAFAPVGLMLDFWDDELPAGGQRALPVVVINDLAAEWSGQVRLRLLRGPEVLSVQSQPATVAAFGDRRVTFSFTAPTAPGSYTLEAALLAPGAAPTRSLRDFAVGEPPRYPGRLLGPLPKP